MVPVSTGSPFFVRDVVSNINRTRGEHGLPAWYQSFEMGNPWSCSVILCSNFSLKIENQKLYNKKTTIYIHTQNGKQIYIWLEQYPSGASEFTPSFSEVRVPRSSVLCVMLSRLLFVLLSFFFWLLCCNCLSFDLWILITPLVSWLLCCNCLSLDLRILITPLVSSNYSYLIKLAWGPQYIL